MTFSLAQLIKTRQEVDRIVSAFDKVMSEAENIRGQVWGMSAALIKNAIAP